VRPRRRVPKELNIWHSLYRPTVVYIPNINRLTHGLAPIHIRHRLHMYICMPMYIHTGLCHIGLSLAFPCKYCLLMRLNLCHREEVVENGDNYGDNSLFAWQFYFSFRLLQWCCIVWLTSDCIQEATNHLLRLIIIGLHLVRMLYLQTLILQSSLMLSLIGAGIGLKALSPWSGLKA